MKPIEPACFADGRPFTRAEARAVLLDFSRLPAEVRLRAYLTLPPPLLRAILEEWWWQAHGGQIEPEAARNGEPWRVWAIIAGRHFGKTRAGAEWAWARAREDKAARIALVGASLDEVARVMVEGESGLLAVARCDEEPRWIASRGLFLFPSGAQAHAFSAERPDKLRGPQHHHAWCDELAKWPNADATWDNLMLGLRLGERPRCLVTTTPKPVPALHRILALSRTVRTNGRSDENPNGAPDFIAAMNELYAGTRFGRQELEGLLLDDFEGTLWTREMLEKARGQPSARRRGDAESPNPARREAEPPDSGEFGASPGADEDGGLSAPLRLCANPEDFARIVVGVDPPASTGGNSCGIVVCGLDREEIAWVLADLTAQGLSPEAWARRVAGAAAHWRASRIVAEKNQGGDMIESVLRAVDADLPIHLVPAIHSKAARAEPIALRFETGRAKLAGSFPELEDQLCALTWSGYQGPGSPDRADAMVWAMTELFEKGLGTPRIRRL